MNIVIGIPLIWSGLVCSPVEGAPPPTINCFSPGYVEYMKLMPQAVVYCVRYKDGHIVKIVRMGTITDPVRNFYVITSKPIIGSGIKEGKMYVSGSCDEAQF